MQSATWPKPIPTARTFERYGSTAGERTIFHAGTEAPADRLNAAKGSLLGIALGGGLWAAIIGLIAILRR